MTGFYNDRPMPPSREPGRRAAVAIHVSVASLGEMKSPGMKAMAWYVLLLSSLFCVGGCASPTIHSLDSKANYGYVFNGVSAPEPTIIHSHVERDQRSVLGIFPLRSESNGDWEFELVASTAWLEEVKAGCTKIQFADVSPRQLPDWFLPSSEEFTVCRMQATSYPTVHLFIEKKPRSQAGIRVFIRRH
jgi:hypothetical protein